MKKESLSSDLIFDRLVSVGIPREEVSKVLDAVDSGFKQGVNDVISGGVSTDKSNFGHDPIFDIAFREGRIAMRFASPFWVLFRFVMKFLFLILLIAIVGYFTVGR